MSKIFISYSRRSGTIAEALAKDIEALGHTAWFDQELSGGQVWWEKILATIRECDVLAVIVDPETLNSSACQLEYEYAGALRKPILPILAAEGVSTSLLPRALSVIQFVDYRARDRDAALRLARAFTALPAPAPLPDPLPVPPDAPLSYLGTLSERINRVGTLSYEEQTALVVDLRRNVQARETRDDARTLLERLRRRRDLFAAVAEEIDETLRDHSAPSSPTTPAVPDRPKAAPHVSPELPRPSPSSGAESQYGYARWLWAAGAAVAGSAAVFAALVADEYRASDWFAVLVVFGSIPWAIAGAVARGRTQPTTLAIVAAIFGGLLVGALTSAANSSTPAISAMGFGTAPGVIFGAVAGAILERRRVKTLPSTPVGLD